MSFLFFSLFSCLHTSISVLNFELVIALNNLDLFKLEGVTFVILILRGLPDLDKSKVITAVPLLSLGISLLLQKGSLKSINSAGTCGTLQGPQAETPLENANIKINNIFMII